MQKTQNEILDSDFIPGIGKLSPFKAWEKRRLVYNAWMLGVSIISFPIFRERFINDFRDNALIPDYYAELFIPQLVGLYILILVVLNLCFFFGFISEKVFRPKHVMAYRNVVFKIGLCCSLLFILLLPYIFI